VHHEFPIASTLPLALSQALAAPLQALVALNAERVSEMVKAMAEKDLEIEKAKHAAEIEAVKNEAKIRDLEKSHQIELERVKHEAERAQWELKAASIRQGQRDEPERDFTRDPEVPQPTTGQHANPKAASACLWLALYGAPQRMDACHFNRHSTFVKACSSILVDREEDTWIALIELEKPMNTADLTKELKPLAKEVIFVLKRCLLPVTAVSNRRTCSPDRSSLRVVAGVRPKISTPLLSWKPRATTSIARAGSSSSSTPRTPTSCATTRGWHCFRSFGSWSDGIPLFRAMGWHGRLVAARTKINPVRHGLRDGYSHDITTVLSTRISHTSRQQMKPKIESKNIQKNKFSPIFTRVFANSHSMILT